MRTLLIAWLSLALLGSVNAQIKLSSLFQDNMVLQQNSKAAIWGTAPPGEQIWIKASWARTSMLALTGPGGKWMARISTPAYGGPFNIQIRSKSDTITLNNVAIGEVWLCSGQSNMAWTANQGIDSAETAIREANYPDIRLFKVDRTPALEPQDQCEGQWTVCSPETMRQFSAVGYFFGRRLHTDLNVPIGLIQSSWGGTLAEAWTNESELKSLTGLDNYLHQLAEENKAPENPNRPGALYNGMIHPLIPYQLAGVIWYQGESNTRDPDAYRQIFPMMIRNWRSEWRYVFPFYFVQIAPYAYPGKSDKIAALVREAQEEALKLPQTGMVVTTDLGNTQDIHPRKKKEVGERLARHALAKVYDYSVSYSGPVLENTRVVENKMELYFKNTFGELVVKGDSVSSLRIAGPDRKFLPARVTIKDSTIIAHHPEVENPAAVRFGFSNTAEAEVFGKNGLPIAPFRTDRWPVVVDMVSIQPVDPAKPGRLPIQLSVPDSNLQIVYTIDGTVPDGSSKRYRTAIELNASATLCARAIDQDGNLGPVTSLPVVWHQAIGSKVNYQSEYSPQYSGGGPQALVDGILGTDDYRKSWQGFEGQDLDITIELNSSKSINELRIGFLQSIGAWIFLPKDIQLECSANGKDWVSVYQETFPSPQAGQPNTTKHCAVSGIEGKFKFIRIKASSIGSCPDWHPGSGNKSWIFVDEVVIK